MLTVLLLLAGSVLPAQDERPAAKFSVSVNVVNVFVTARDSQGKIVRNLTKDDFTLEEDGRPQEIRYFSQQSDLPLTLGLLVDTSPSEAKMLEVERNASYKFFESVLRPEKDKAFLIHFDFDVELLQDLTSSREKLEAALRLLEAAHMQGREGRDRNGPGGGPEGGGREPPSGGGPGQSPGGWPGGGTTTLADAIYLASNELMRPQTGRKAMIVLGDGDDIGSKVSLAQAITAAQRADTLVYTIRIFDKDFGGGGRRSRFGLPGMGGPGVWGGGLPGGGGGPGQGGPPGGGGVPPDRGNGKKNLQEISRRAGGVYSEVSKKQPLDQIYSVINEELRNQYSLGYTPDAHASPGYRRIRVAVKRKGVVIQAREGYYADSRLGS